MTKARITVLIALLALAALSPLSGCLWTDGATVENGDCPGGICPVDEPSSVPAAELAPDFTITDVGGNKFNLSDFRGKPVVLDFMATWCGPCGRQIDELKKLAQKYGESVKIISIDADNRESAQELEEFRDSRAANWTFAAKGSDAFSKYMINGYIPTIAVVAADGTLAHVGEGVESADKISDIIEESWNFK